MTREEVEKDVKSIGRTCRGPLLLAEDEINTYRDILNKALEDMSPLNQAILIALKTALELRYGLPQEECTEINKLVNRVVALVFARNDTIGKPMCGYDVNQIILSNPFDGKEHEYICPRCGLEEFYIAPICEEELEITNDSSD